MNFTKTEAIFINPAIPVDLTGITVGQVMGFNGTNLVPSTVAGTNDLTSYLPLSAGTAKQLTGVLYATNNTIVNTISGKTLDQQDTNAKITFQDSQLTLSVYDSPVGNWEDAIYIHNGEGNEGSVVDVNSTEFNFNNSPVATETLVANYGTNYLSVTSGSNYMLIAGGTFTGTISATNGINAQTISNGTNPGTVYLDSNFYGYGLNANVVAKTAINLGMYSDQPGNSTTNSMLITGTQVTALIPFSAGTNKITSSYVPSANEDLVNVLYQSQIISNYLPLVGGSMTGGISTSKAIAGTDGEIYNVSTAFDNLAVDTDYKPIKYSFAGDLGNAEMTIGFNSGDSNASKPALIEVNVDGNLTLTSSVFGGSLFARYAGLETANISDTLTSSIINSTTLNNTGVLAVGGTGTTTIAGIVPKTYITTANNEISSVQFRNTSTGTNASMRFMVVGNTDDYMAFDQPGSNNISTAIFGLAKNTHGFIFSNGAANRNLAIGTVSNSDLKFGTNNTIKAVLTAAGSLGVGVTTPSTAVTATINNGIAFANSTTGIVTGSWRFITSGTGATSQMKLDRYDGTNWQTIQTFS